MPGAVPRYQHGPITYEVVEAVKGGQLVEARAASKVGVGAAASVKILGVATKDALPVGASQDYTDANFGSVVNTSPISQYVAVDSEGVWNLKTVDALAFGDLVKAGATGQVQKLVVGTDNTSQVVGRCVEPAGVSAGANGLIKLVL